MSEPINLQNLLKSLPAVSDLSSAKALVFDTNGNPKNASSAILGLGYRIRDASGAFLSFLGTSLVIAIDRANPTKVLVYIAYWLTGNHPVRIQIYSNGLSFGAENGQGTMLVNGGTDVVQYAIGLGDLSESYQSNNLGG